LRRILKEIREHGADAIVIGSGNPDQAKDFQRTTGLDAPVFCDPDLKSYAGAGMKRGVGTFLKVATVTNAVRAFTSGFRQGRTQGDALQQGGVLVVAKGGALVYQHADEVGGEGLPLEEILAAVKRAKAG